MMATFADDDEAAGDKMSPATSPEQLLQRAAEGDAFAHHRLGFLYLKGRDGWPQNEELAFDYFSKGSGLGSLSSTYMMGWCYFQGRGVKRDYHRAAQIMKRAADAGHRTSIRSLAFCYEGGLGVTKSPVQAAQLYAKAVELGDVKALNDLAWCYSRGVGVEVNEAKSVELFERAVAAGNRHAMFNLGVRYLSGQTGLGKDETLAVTLFQRGADLGDPSSMCTLGGLYLRGIGIPVDVDRGIALYKQAASLGHAKSLHKLARCFSKGLGVPKDEARAMQLYERAAQLGHTKSVFRLARYYVKGTASIPKDEQKAVMLYQEASDRGHAAATYNLGMRFKEGRGVERNDQLCFSLFKQAAQMNFPPAQYRLATCYLRGIGVIPDEGMALYYFSKAASSCDDRVTSSAAKELGAIRSHIPAGSTVLHEIARLGDMQRLPEQLAVTHDIDFPRALDLKSSLMLAFEYRRIQTAEHLLARGASVSSVDMLSLCNSFGPEAHPYLGITETDPTAGNGAEITAIPESSEPSAAATAAAGCLEEEVTFHHIWQAIQQGISLQSQCRRVILYAQLNLTGLPDEVQQFIGPPLPPIQLKEYQRKPEPVSIPKRASSPITPVRQEAPPPLKTKKSLFSFVFRSRKPRAPKSSSRSNEPMSTKIPPPPMRDSWDHTPEAISDDGANTSALGHASLSIDVEEAGPSSSTPLPSRSSDSADSDEMNPITPEDLELSNGSHADHRSKKKKRLSKKSEKRTPSN